MNLLKKKLNYFILNQIPKLVKTIILDYFIKPIFMHLIQNEFLKTIFWEI